MPVHADITVSATVTATQWVPLDQFETPFNVSFGVVLEGNGTRVFSVEHTFDDVFDPDVTPVAFTNTGVSAAIQSIDGNYIVPVVAIRLNVASGSASATTRFIVRQTGSPN